MTDFNPLELLRAFQAGDESAFETVFRTHYKALRVQAFLLLDNKEDAEDQVQQLFLDIWNRQLYKNVNESLKSYLHTAIRNRCLNFLNRSLRTKKHTADYAESCELHYLPQENEPELELHYSSALERLPAQRFRAFKLVYMEDKKYLQAATEMGISINSLKSHLKLAVKFLRVQLER